MTEMLSVETASITGGGTGVFRYPKATLRVQASALLVLVDAAAVLIGMSLPRWLGAGPEARIDPDIVLVVTVAYVGAALIRRAYGYPVLASLTCGVVRALAAFALVLILGQAMTFLLRAGEDIPRWGLALSSVGAGALLVFGRLVAAMVLKTVFRDGLTNKLILCDGPVRKAKPGEIVVSTRQADLRPCVDDPVLLDRIGRLARNADRVIVQCAASDRAAWAHVLKGLGTDVEILVPEFDDLGMLGFERFDGARTALVGRGPMKARDRLTKRAFDLFVVVVLAPLVLCLGILAAIAIKLEDRGPVFFSQIRVGEANRLFRVMKFRTMRVELSDADGVRSASRDDDRVTRVGRLLRATSIDELPQLLNVLKGEMSIVGPRPHALKSTAENDLFWDVDHRYWHRHAARPGMTGLAQVRGLRGATMARRDLIERLQADLEYLVCWSVWRDIRIILATCRVVLHHKAF